MPFDAVPRKQNATAAGLRDMAAWFRVHGFTPHFGRCFASCAAEVTGFDADKAEPITTAALDAVRFTGRFAGLTQSLIDAGFTTDTTGEKAARHCERIAERLEALA